MCRKMARSSARQARSFACVISLFLTACTTIEVSRPGYSVTHHFGYVRVVGSSAKDAQIVRATSTHTVGVWLLSDDATGRHNGGLGYLHAESTSMPQDCHVVFNVRTDEQLAALVTALKQLDFDKEQTCITHPSTVNSGSVVSQLP